MSATDIDTAAALRQLFGDNRAEWPAANFEKLFVAPTYLKKLESMRPCFLVGGRGTGKTTSLQSLRYDSSLQRIESIGLGYDDQEYLGVMVRMNKNRVRAFHGASIGEDGEEGWRRLFAHYFNLLVCSELATMTAWLQKRTNTKLSTKSLSLISSEFGFDDVNNIEDLQDAIKHGISRLQIQVNNPARNLGLVLSIAESPLRSFVEMLSKDGLIGDRVIFCCIDEYENLLDYQQAVVNTYIKHAEPPLSYKVGVRKSGLRCRSTLDGQDLLRTPDDYLEIEIAEEGFEYFAKAVAETRLDYALKKGVRVPASLKEFLSELSFHEEAALLGAEKVADTILKELETEDLELHAYFNNKPKTEIYFLKYWRESEGRKLLDLARDWRAHEAEWKTRFGNYGYSSLFWLSRGNKGVRIRKYYCGERILLSLAGGNIRYFLELIDAAISQELENNLPSEGPLIVSPRSQTLAAREVGKRRLNQLEGLADHGVQLKRLVLAVGKVFFELARAPNGKTPEVTSFILTGRQNDVAKIQKLLEEGISHLAFESDPKTKPTSTVEMRDDEYRLHRIFCAFFEISHRKKRRMTFDAKQLLDVLGDRPSKAISELLEDCPQSAEQELPEQLAFFSAFYDDGEKSEFI